MHNLEVGKKLLTGIFSKNDELCEIDDSIFIPLIKAGIEEAARDVNAIYEELLEHAVKLYTDRWLELASEDEDEPDLEIEETEARRTFLKYFNDKT
jgi:hypothetical protein